MKQIVSLFALCTYMSTGFAQSSYDVLSLELTQSSYSGDAKEIVYDPSNGQLLSLLTFDIQDIKITELGIKLGDGNKSTLKISTLLSSNNGNGELIDEDWLNGEYQPRTHFSVSPVNSEINERFNFEAQYEIKSHNNETIYTLFGYLHEKWYWQAIGGHYIYPLESGTFADSEVITYEQILQVPYFGIAYQVEPNPFLINLSFKYGVRGKMKDKDHHILRKTFFYQSFSDIEFILLSAEARYRINNKMSIVGTLDYRTVNASNGAIVIDEYGAGNMYVVPNAAGVENNTNKLSISLEYKL